jgi:hypothetical protein
MSKKVRRRNRYNNKYTFKLLIFLNIIPYETSYECQDQYIWSINAYIRNELYIHYRHDILHFVQTFGIYFLYLHKVSFLWLFKSQNMLM